MAVSRSQHPDVRGSQEGDGKKLLPSVSGASKPFLSTLCGVLEQNKSKPILERVHCFKINLECYTPSSAGCSILTLLHLISFSHP